MCALFGVGDASPRHPPCLYVLIVASADGDDAKECCDAQRRASGGYLGHLLGFGWFQVSDDLEAVVVELIGDRRPGEAAVGYCGRQRCEQVGAGAGAV